MSEVEPNPPTKVTAASGTIVNTGPTKLATTVDPRLGNSSSSNSTPSPINLEPVVSRKGNEKVSEKE
jgi:hypothetical protein